MKFKAEHKEGKNPENTITVGIDTKNNVELLSLSLGNKKSNL